MNLFHPPDVRRKTSDAVKEFLSLEQVIVIFVWDTREYAKFSTSPSHKLIFKQVTQSLADEGRRFLVLSDRGQVIVRSIRSLWDEALSARLVLAGQKLDPSDHVRTSLSVQTDEDLYNFIDRQFQNR
jgi:hypothetical protein